MEDDISKYCQSINSDCMFELYFQELPQFTKHSQIARFSMVIIRFAVQVVQVAEIYIIT